MLEEDAIATDESKIIDNAWRGAEVTIQIISLQHTFSHMVLRISLYFRKLDLISFQYIQIDFSCGFLGVGSDFVTNSYGE